MEYHLFHYNNSISKKSNIKTNSNNIMLYLSKLKQQAAWLKKVKEIIDVLKMGENSKKEFEIIDKTLNNWIKNKNTNLPES